MLPATVLAADDDSLTLRILQDTLEDAGFEVVTADNGRRALDLLLAHPDRFSAIVLDRIMPEMDGMAFLAAIQDNEQVSGIPVVLQTAAASPQEMQEGINAGAFYYVTKPYDETTLVAIVNSAIQRYRQTQSWNMYNAVQVDGLEFLECGRFRFRSLQDAKSIVWMICQHAENSAEVSIGLMELIINAIEHGNLGIGGAEKEKLIRENRWEDEIKRREALPENRGKSVVVAFDASGPDQVTAVILDQGAGFDWQSYLHGDLDLENKVQGRGIQVAKTMAFQNIEYDKGGAQVTVTFDKL